MEVIKCWLMKYYICTRSYTSQEEELKFIRYTEKFHLWSIRFDETTESEIFDLYQILYFTSVNFSVLLWYQTFL